MKAALARTGRFFNFTREAAHVPAFLTDGVCDNLLTFQHGFRSPITTLALRPQWLVINNPQRATLTLSLPLWDLRIIRLRAPIMDDCPAIGAFCASEQLSWLSAIELGMLVDQFLPPIYLNIVNLSVILMLTCTD
jgi:hypothetical protein